MKALSVPGSATPLSCREVFQTVQHAARTSMKVLWLLPCLLPAAPIIAIAAPPTHAQATTAAEQDWVPAHPGRNGTNGIEDRAAEGRGPDWACDGAYLPPDEFRQPLVHFDPITIITARDAVHRSGESTTLTGDVEIVGEGRKITASHAVRDIGTERLTASGPVTLREYGLFIKAEQASGNLVNGTGIMDHASFLLHESRMHGQADSIARVAGGALNIRAGTFTRCDPGNNLWRVDGKEIRLYPDQGHGVARNVIVRIKDIPLAYFPYIRFPLDDRRQTGFLAPSGSHDNDGGTDIAIPYYINLAPDYDATLTLRSIWKRGVLYDAEFRYLNTVSSNALNLAHLSGDDRYLARNPDVADQQHDRWLMYFNHAGKGELAAGSWRSEVSFGAVSDIDYLNDIGGDVDASTRETFSSFQSLGSNTIPALNRTGRFDYRIGAWNIGLLARGYQTLQPDAAPQYETLPQLTVRTYRRSRALEMEFMTQYTSFDKDNQSLSGIDAIVGQRLLVDTSLALPLRKPWGFFIPRANVLHRQYNLRDTPARTDADPGLTISSLSIDTGLIFDRFFESRTGQLQQTLEPRLYFLYVPTREQDHLPAFDAALATTSFDRIFRDNRFSGYDRIGDARQVAAGVSSSLLDAASGEQYLDIGFGQVFYFKDREVIFAPGRADDPTIDSSALYSDADVRLGNRLTLRGSFEWDPHVSRSNRGKLALRYHSPDQRKILNLNYSYTSPDIQPVGRFQNSEESDLSFIWPLTRKWSVVGRWNFGWDNNQTIESLFGFEYNDCCWKTRLLYRRFLEDPRGIPVIVSGPGGNRVEFVLDQPVDSGIYFEFQLKGLSSLGKRVDSLLEMTIPGYREREDRINR
jgi:LPS-assembly protein